MSESEAARPLVPSLEYVLNVRAGCGMKCIFCNRSPDRVGHDIAAVLDPAFPLPDARRYLIASGDVIRADLAPLVRRMRERAAEVVVYAHPGLRDFPALRTLAEAGLTGLLLMVPAADSRAMAHLTRQSATVRDMAVVIEAANQLDLVVELDMPVLPETVDALPDTLHRALARIRRPGAVHLTFSAGALTGLPVPWDFRRAAPRVQQTIAVARDARIPVRLANPAPPPCVFQVAEADGDLYPLLMDTGGRPDGGDPFPACAECVLAGGCRKDLIHFAPDLTLGPVKPVKRPPAGSPDDVPPSSAELYLRRRDLSTLLERLGKRPLVCTSPWSVLAAHDTSGHLSPCKGSLLRPEVRDRAGNWITTPLLDVWNSDGLRDVRRAIADGEPERTCKADCPVFYGVRHTFEPPDGVPRGRRHYENLVLQIEEMIDGADRLKSLPSCLIVTPSMRCNNRCRMCEVHEQYHGFEELPDTLYQSIRDLLPALRNLSFGGAEPLMASRFPALLRECDADRHPDLELTLTTNGLLLTPAMLSDMARPRFNTIIVSVNAATAEAYDVISGTAGRFPRVIANISALVEAARGWRWQPDLQLSFVVTSSTWRETAAFIALARSLGTAFRLLPVEYDRLGESVFTDLDTMRNVLAHFERDVRPLVADLPPVLRAQATMMEARLRERIAAGRTGAL